MAAKQREDKDYNNRIEITPAGNTRLVKTGQLWAT